MHSSVVTVLIVATAGLVGCDMAVAPTIRNPPTLYQVVLTTATEITEGAIHYVFADGRAAWVMTGGRTLINDGTGDLVIIGHDGRGGFVAGYTRQGGLPTDCFVDNSTGIDRGAYIELRNILWTKTTNFGAANAVAPDHQYPGGTRFCFNEFGEIWRTVAS
jgi:hypothetical protein